MKTKSNPLIKIPDKNSAFVPWGNFQNISDGIASGKFFPMYVCGMSGNGKTMMVEQACAQLGREMVRVQISPETDEDDLIGGLRLVKGETVFEKGPVVLAMEAGAVLLVDEIDRGTNKIMCLQGVLENKPIMIKKTGEIISPKKGFTVIATANTNGRGASSRYTAASVIDDAFLERFKVNIEQPYPNEKIETDILHQHATREGEDANEPSLSTFIKRLVRWSQIVRKTYEEEGINDMISTRRLCDCITTWTIYRDNLASVDLCTNRFEPDTREGLRSLFTKISHN